MNLDEIESLLLKLDYSWFQCKKKAFTSEAFYNKKNHKISGVIDVQTSMNINNYEWIDREQDVEIDVNLNGYCWNGYFKSSIQESLLTDEVQFMHPLAEA